MPLESLEHLSQEEIFDGWKFPPKMPVLARHSWCALNNKNYGSYLHRRYIIESFWSKDQYELHEWDQRRLRGTCTHKWCTWLGPGGSGKTTSAAIAALEWWLEAPQDSCVIVASTSVSMLKSRIWSSIVEYHTLLAQNLLQGKVRHAPKVKTQAQLDAMIGQLVDSDVSIRYQAGDHKHRIHGVAVDDGPVESVVNNLIGIHVNRYWLILDEMQGVREAILKATSNMAKNPVFQFLGMGNPDSMTNMLVRKSEPLGGWDSVERGFTPEWETVGGPMKGNGLCLFFRGDQSPACKDPEFAKRNPWMINMDQIEGHLKSLGGNDNDPEFWSQSIGWPPQQGTQNTVLDSATVDAFKLREKAIWTNGKRKWAACDPAFEGADARVLKFGNFGRTTNADEYGERWVIEQTEVLKVPVDINSEVPIHYQMAYFIRDECVARGITAEYLAIDSTGEGGALLSILQREFGAVVGVEFGGKASDMPVDDGTDRKASDVYDRKASELNLMIREFALGHGLRGLDDQTIKECCARKTYFKNKKRIVEPKGARLVDGQKIAGFRDRMGYSPDYADALAVGVHLCREHGAYPSTLDAPVPVSKNEEPVDPYAPQPVDEYSEESYAMSDQW